MGSVVNFVPLLEGLHSLGRVLHSKALVLGPPYVPENAGLFIQIQLTEGFPRSDSFLRRMRWSLRLTSGEIIPMRVRRVSCQGTPVRLFLEFESGTDRRKVSVVPDLHRSNVARVEATHVTASAVGMTMVFENVFALA